MEIGVGAHATPIPDRSFTRSKPDNRRHRPTCSRARRLVSRLWPRTSRHSPCILGVLRESLGCQVCRFIGDSNSTGRNVDSDDRFSRSFIFHDVIPFLFQIFGAAMALQLDWSLLLVAMLGQNLRSGLELIHCLFLHFNVFRS